MFKPLAD